jgi:sec-independent protein translocase protein TatA
MRIGATEILLILVLALVIFGGNKLSGVGKALGQSIREFKKEIASDNKEGEEKPEAASENKPEAKD